VKAVDARSKCVSLTGEFRLSALGAESPDGFRPKFRFYHEQHHEPRNLDDAAVYVNGVRQMKTISLALVGVVLALLVTATTASAQSAESLCGLVGQTKIFGCLDSINGLPSFSEEVTVRQSEPIVLQGWALSGYTAQQPSIVQVFYTGELKSINDRRLVALDPADFTITWRGYRPDVFAYFAHKFDLTSTLWGYAIVIKEGVLPLRENHITIRFTDPIVGVGVNHQQIAFMVVP